ncbi:EAL domain-containing protein [Amphritea opalescens]|uniref:EAL domain-containing protein n=1 Tax=Amphritea opalescens TaxID=2490544 RepID=A0A430KLE1_9GAMM|nr:EAL domain-containing protein [Amphritea opalescens]
MASHFQPIYSIAHRRAIGYEGLIRATSPQGLAIPPAELLALPANSQEMLGLDRLCRSLHVENFTAQSANNEWLFVNLDAQSLLNEQPEIGFTQQLLTQSGLSPHRLVIEILETEVQDIDYLKHFIDYFHQLNCLIAIDDFGAGHSNFDRIWQLEPDIVKLDRNLIREAALSKRAERILSGIISLLHQTGSLVIVEGVETEREAEVAIAANADMMQGFYFARPAPLLTADNNTCDIIDQLLHNQHHQRSQRSQSKASSLQRIESLFQLALDDLKTHQNLQQSSAQIFCNPHAVRCFLLDESGYQTQSTLNAFHHRQRIQLRFAPLICGDKGNWSHRPYHHRALEQPGTTIVSDPYLSVADSQMCITLSQALKIDNQWQVFCCDLDWHDEG